jgi:hypothetical protein
MERLRKIQQELKCPKSRDNKYGGFKYRSAEDILEAVKPLLGDLSLVINSVPVIVGDWHYVTCVVRLYSPNRELITESTASAREQAERKGMDSAQISGCAISYAKKYALANLFALDDGNDPDGYNKDQEPTGNGKQQSPPPATQSPPPAATQPPPTTPPPQAKYPGKVDAPTTEERARMVGLEDFYKTKVTAGMKYSREKLRDKVLVHLGRWPKDEKDIALVKQYIHPTEVMVKE